MNKALRECMHPGCVALVKGRYCSAHNVKSEYVRDEWKEKFYGSRRWFNTSRRFKAANPLCIDCQDAGVVRVVEVVHHYPYLEDLIDKNIDDGHSFEYLYALCKECHTKRHSGDTKKGQSKKIKQGTGVPDNLKE